MTTINHTATAAVPVDRAFAHVADYRTVPTWFFGISRFVPQGTKDYGLGAVYEGRTELAVEFTYDLPAVSRARPSACSSSPSPSSP